MGLRLRAQEECHRLLALHGISHFFVHLPLDYADFGTCPSLFQAIGIDAIIQNSYPHEGRSVPGIGEFESPISFGELSERIEFGIKRADKILEELGQGDQTSRDHHRGRQCYVKHSRCPSFGMRCLYYRRKSYTPCNTPPSSK